MTENIGTMWGKKKLSEISSLVFNYSIMILIYIHSLPYGMSKLHSQDVKKYLISIQFCSFYFHLLLLRARARSIG